ncbi:MAG TPA: hypothetical protein VNC22_13990 [Sporichthya sp.]|nr:hypothetical protein [Sporichthya sp.]
MPRLRSRVALLSATTLAATAAVASLTIGSSSASPTTSGEGLAPAVTTGINAKAHQGVKIRGAVQHRGRLDRGDLQSLTQVKLTQHYLTSSGTHQHTFTGPLLLDVLNGAGPMFSSDQHDPLRFVILAKAADNFLAALSWGEIAPDLAGKKVLIALTEDGTTLDRPRLVIPGDKHGARQVYDLASLTLIRLGPVDNAVAMSM